MSNILVLTVSATSAARLAKRLTKNGDMKAHVINTPKEISQGGCSYAVAADLSSESFIRNNIHGITVKKIYIEEISGGRRFYHDIS